MWQVTEKIGDEQKKKVFHYFHNPNTLPKTILALFNKTSEIHGFHTRSTDNFSLHTHFGKLHVRATSIKFFGAFLWNKIPISIRQFSSLYLF